MARPERLELPTAWFVARYSIQLSYGRILKLDWRLYRNRVESHSDMAVVGVCCEPVSVDFPVIGKYTGNFHTFRQILTVIRLQGPVIPAILFLLGAIWNY